MSASRSVPRATTLRRRSEIAAEAVQDGGIDQCQCAAPSGGEGPGPVEIPVALQAPSRDGDGLLDEHHGRLRGGSEDECFDAADARLGCGVRRPCRNVQWRHNEAVEDVVGGVGGIPDRAGRDAEHHGGTGRCRRASGDPRSGPTERCRVVYGHEAEPALAEPRALLVWVQRDVAADAPATCAMQAASVDRSLWPGSEGKVMASAPGRGRARGRRDARSRR